MQGTTDRHTYIFGESVMRVEIELDDYSKEKGVQLKWEEGYSVKVEKENNEILIFANKEGLISLANHLLSLAQEGVEKRNPHSLR